MGLCIKAKTKVQHIWRQYTHGELSLLQTNIRNRFRIDSRGQREPEGSDLRTSIALPDVMPAQIDPELPPAQALDDVMSRLCAGRSSAAIICGGGKNSGVLHDDPRSRTGR